LLVDFPEGWVLPSQESGRSSGPGPTSVPMLPTAAADNLPLYTRPHLRGDAPPYPVPTPPSSAQRGVRRERLAGAAVRFRHPGAS